MAQEANRRVRIRPHKKIITKQKGNKHSSTKNVRTQENLQLNTKIKEKKNAALLFKIAY